MRVTHFEFLIEGQSEKHIKKVTDALRELGIGHIRVYSGSLKKETNVTFQSDGHGYIHNTDFGKFVGIKRNGELSGEYVSKVSKVKKASKGKR